MALQNQLPFYPSKWLQDKELQGCSLATRGCWMNLLCWMFQRGQSGELTGTAAELAELAVCTTTELTDALRQLKEEGAALVKFDGVQFYVRNRRMYKIAERRKYNAAKQKEYRDEARVSPTHQAFEKFWAVYPCGRKQNKKEALEAFRRAVEITDAETIIVAAREYASSEQGKGIYVRGPTPWLNQHGWNDDRHAWQDKDKKGYNNQIITKEEFATHIKKKEFTHVRRDTQNELHVWGILKCGKHVECLTYYPPPKQEKSDES